MRSQGPAKTDKGPHLAQSKFIWITYPVLLLTTGKMTSGK